MGVVEVLKEVGGRELVETVKRGWNLWSLAFPRSCCYTLACGRPRHRDQFGTSCILCGRDDSHAGQAFLEIRRVKYLPLLSIPKRNVLPFVMKFSV